MLSYRARISRFLAVTLLLSLFMVIPVGQSSTFAAAGYTDSSVSFNGSSQYAVASGAQVIPASSSAGSFFTVEAWVYPRAATASSTNGVILSQGVGSTRFYMKRNTGKLVFYREGQSSEGICGALVENTWTHIAVIVGTSNSYCYLNGQLSGSFSYASTTAIGTTLVLSQYSYGFPGSQSATEYFNGLIDEVKIWNIDRSANVQTDMNSYNPSASGLTGYYDFNEGSGTTLNNRVPGASASTNLTLTGSPSYASVESSTIINGDQVVLFPRTYLNSNGGWQIPSHVSTMKALVVAGGGAGGSRSGGGGGAGGYTYSAAQGVTPNSFQSIVVGQGGIGGNAANYGQGSNGGPSNLGSLITTFGGGGGGGTGFGSGNAPDSYRAGLNGGSGGGATGALTGGGTAQIGGGTTGQGTNGGTGVGSGNYPAGGGGGANQSGGNYNVNTGGSGGAGISDPIAATSICYATGGGGGTYTGYTGGAGGNCGGSANPNGNSGGAGAALMTTPPTTNTGAGGGGNGWTSSTDYAGQSGASGVIILRYPLNMSVTLSYSGGAEATYRTLGTITATGSLAGKVTFYERGKAIPGCVRISMNGSNVATCSWKPSLHGSTTITATAKPSNTYVPNGSTVLNLAVVKRTNKR